MGGRTNAATLHYKPRSMMYVFMEGAAVVCKTKIVFSRKASVVVVRTRLYRKQAFWIRTETCLGTLNNKKVTKMSDIQGNERMRHGNQLKIIVSKQYDSSFFPAACHFSYNSGTKTTHNTNLLVCKRSATQSHSEIKA